jgi:hypothetical protein
MEIKKASIIQAKKYHYVYEPKVNIAAKLSIKLHACLQQLKLPKVKTPTVHSNFPLFSSVFTIPVCIFRLTSWKYA